MGELPVNRTSVLKLAVAFVGVILGAGFVSGQELWQFFACFGVWGFLGFLLSTALFLLVDLALLEVARKQGTTNVGKLILPGDHPWLCIAIDLMQCLLLFGIVVIMIAGASALLQDLTGLPAALCGALFTVLVLIGAMFEMRGVITAFSVLVPILCATAVLLGITVLFRQEFRFAPASGSVSTLLPNWWISGITYSAYNLFGSIGILVSFAALVPSRKTIGRGLALGAVLLLVLTFCILAALAALPAMGHTELPTAAIAMQIHPVLGMGHQLLMGLAMFSSALSSLIAMTHQASFHWPVLQSKRRWFLALFAAAAFCLSLAGFGNLISIVYPVFGYVSIPLLALLVRNWWKSRTAS